MVYCFCVLFFIYRLFSLSKETRLLQLNHYQISRTLRHLKKQTLIKKSTLMKLIWHLPFVLLMFIDTTQKEMASLLFIVYCYLRYRFQATKKNVTLHYTRRMLRLYAGLFLFYLGMFIYFWNQDYFLWGMLFMMCANPLVVTFIFLLLYPFESMIRNYYVFCAHQKRKKNRGLIVIGIVGSYGKTSTKNIIYALLSRKFYCLKSDKSLNNLMGNTITIRKRLKKVHELLIAEMGSDHNGEIHRLMKLVEPRYVVITSVGNQHMETFRTQDNIIKEKMSPLQYLKEEGIAFLNIDNTYIYEHQKEGCCRKVTFGEHKEADYRISKIHLYEWGSRFHISAYGEEHVMETSLLGYYNIMNIAGSIAVAHTLGISFEEIKEVLFSLHPVEHRLESIRKNHYTLIDNAYNSNVYSFKNSLQVLKQISKYRIFITPGLIDLKDDEKINNELMDHVSGCMDEMIVVGYRNRSAIVEGLTRNHISCYRLMDTMEEALQYVDNLDRKDFVVLIENDIDKDYMNYM